MSDTLPHIGWLRDTGETVVTACGLEAEVWEFDHQNDAAALSAWAHHFRQHYCYDALIDALRDGTGLSRAEFLHQRKFPDGEGFGPATRAGDFGEIMLCDYLQFHLGCIVPRERYRKKTIPNESIKGCDVVGYRFAVDGAFSPRDQLYTVEVKASFTRNQAPSGARMQLAVDGSAADKIRLAHSLNAVKQEWLDRGLTDKVKEIARFQNPSDRPYKHIFSAALVICNSSFGEECVTEVDTTPHPHRTELNLIVIRGEDMMRLVHALYEQAANEA